MQISVLGAGTCVSQLPNIPNQFPPSFFVQWDNHHLLLECPEATRFRLEELGLDFASIKNIAISHAHPDHCALVHYVQSVYVKGIYDAPTKNPTITVYSPKQLATHYKDVWQFHVPEMTSNNYEWPVLRFVTPKGGEVIGAATLTAFSVMHGFNRIESFGYRLETPDGVLAYSGDTGLCDGVLALAKNADFFICEAALRIGNEKPATTYGHLTPRLAGAVARQAGVKKIGLMHYTGLDSVADLEADCRASGFAGEIVVLRDKMMLEV